MIGNLGLWKHYRALGLPIAIFWVDKGMDPILSGSRSLLNGPHHSTNWLGFWILGHAVGDLCYVKLLCLLWVGKYESNKFLSCDIYDCYPHNLEELHFAFMMKVQVF